MYHLNNHFEKSVIILVITMFLTIPNMHVYSFVGKYLTTSPALTANASNSFTKKEHFFNLPALACLTFAGIIIASMLAILAADEVLHEAIDAEVYDTGAATIVGLADAGLPDPDEMPSSFNSKSNYKNHVAHNFLKFDN